MIGNHVAIYVRLASAPLGVSDPNVQRQLETVRSYAERQGWTVACEFIDVNASGMSTTRRALQQMLDWACTEPPKFTRILIERPDRMFRDWVLYERHRRKLERCGVEIVATAHTVLLTRLASPMTEAEPLHDR